MAGAMAGSAILDYSQPTEQLRLVTLTVNNTCNLTCPHCYLQYDGDETFVDQMTVDRVVTSGCTHVAIVGKEPLVNRAAASKTSSVLQQSAAAGKRVSLITNGIGLDFLPEEAAAVLDFIDVSFDGGPATYQNYRGASYQRLIGRMDRQLSRGFRRFRALSVLSSATLGAIDDIVSVADLPGIELLMLSPYIHTHNDGTNRVTAPSVEDILARLSESRRFRESERTLLLIARHEVGLLGWTSERFDERVNDLGLGHKVRIVDRDPLELGVIRVTYDGLVMTPLASLHPSKYAHLGVPLMGLRDRPLDAVFANLREGAHPQGRHAH